LPPLGCSCGASGHRSGKSSPAPPLLLSRQRTPEAGASGGTRGVGSLKGVLRRTRSRSGDGAHTRRWDEEGGGGRELRLAAPVPVRRTAGVMTDEDDDEDEDEDVEDEDEEEGEEGDDDDDEDDDDDGVSEDEAEFEERILAMASPAVWAGASKEEEEEEEEVMVLLPWEASAGNSPDDSEDEDPLECASLMEDDDAVSLPSSSTSVNSLASEASERECSDHFAREGSSDSLAGGGGMGLPPDCVLLVDEEFWREEADMLSRVYDLEDFSVVVTPPGEGGREGSDYRRPSTESSSEGPLEGERCRREGSEVGGSEVT
jgi:hypothetical protein